MPYKITISNIPITGLTAPLNVGPDGFEMIEFDEITNLNGDTIMQGWEGRLASWSIFRAIDMTDIATLFGGMGPDGSFLRKSIDGYIRCPIWVPGGSTDLWGDWSCKLKAPTKGRFVVPGVRANVDLQISRMEPYTTNFTFPLP